MNKTSLILPRFEPAVHLPRIGFNGTGLDRLDYSGTQVGRPLRIESMPPDSLIDKALGIPRFNPTETCSKIRQVALDANQNVRRSAAPKESCASREYDHATADNLSAATDRGDSPAVTGGSVPENGRHRYCLGGCAIGWQGLPRTDGSGANSLVTKFFCYAAPVFGVAANPTMSPRPTSSQRALLPDLDPHQCRPSIRGIIVPSSRTMA